MSDGFDVRFDDARAFAARMAQAPQIVGDELTRSVDRLTLQGERYTKVETPVRTGHLRRSIAMSPATFAGGAATGSWGTATPYARWIEEGRGPVVASPGKVLRFIPKGSSTPIYRKRVGPARGHFMFKKALAKVRPLVGREMRDGIRRIVVRLGGA